MDPDSWKLYRVEDDADERRGLIPVTRPRIIRWVDLANVHWWQIADGRGVEA